MAKRDDITPERVRELLDYNPETGELTWRNPAWHHWRGRAGNVWKDRSRRLFLEGKLREEHRVIWAWFYGQWPLYTVDHIDEDALNNRIANLREATSRQNNWNKHFKLGRQRKNGKWTCHIRHPVKGKISVGVFNTKQEAIEAYIKEAKEIRGVFLHKSIKKSVTSRHMD